MFRSSLFRLSLGVRAFSGVHSAISARSAVSFSKLPLRFPLNQTRQPLGLSQNFVKNSWKTIFPIEKEAESAWEDETDNTMYMDSVLRKRRLKMKKHKLRKRRRNQRALKKRLGK